MRESTSQYKSRVSLEDSAMSRGFDHDIEVKAGRAIYTIEPSRWRSSWSVLEKTSAGQSHFSGWFESKEEAEQFIIDKQLGNTK